MKKIFFALPLLCGSFLLSSSALATNTVTITEIGAFEPDGKEWVEIYNLSDETVELSEWRFITEEGGKPTNHKINPSSQTTETKINPQEFAIIAEDAEKFISAYPQISGKIFDSSWGTINENGQKKIGLKNAENEIVEFFNYPPAPDFSLEKINLSVPSDDFNNWKEHPSGNTAGQANYWSSHTLESPPTEPAPASPEINVEAPPEENHANPSNNPAPQENQTEPVSQAPSAPEYSRVETPAPAPTAPSPKITSSEPPKPLIWPLEISLTEVFPDPADEKTEFIEIFNSGNDILSLSGLMVDDEDGGSAPFTIPKDISIGPLSFYVFYRDQTGLALNNDGDSVRLLNADKTIFYELKIPKAEPGLGYGKFGNAWFWSETSPNAENQAPKQIEGEKIMVDSNSYFVEQKIGEIKALPDGAKISTEGLVIVAPGLFSEQYFYISDGSGIQIYQHKKDFPDLILGEKIQVTGEISTAYGEKRVKVASAEEIIKITSDPPSIPPDKKIVELSETDMENICRLEGELTEIKKDSAYLDDGTGEIKIIFKANTGLKASSFEIGDQISISGLIQKTENEWKILPRIPSDIIVKEKGSPQNAPEQPPDAKKENHTQRYLWAAVIFCLFILFGKIFFKKNKT